jgi:glycosyltransferase involved in cell wall biosynthesis
MSPITSTPLVSFVVPCYNYGRYLPDCLRGIFDQKGHDDFEIIAVDDGSTDNTRAVLREFADPRLRVILHEKNLGHVATVNRGLAESRGRYVVRVDPDDRHRACFLAETVPILERYPEVGLVHGDVALVNENGEVTAELGGTLGEEDRKGNELVRILQKNYICAPTVLARREAWMSAWPVPEGLAFNDWYFNVMLARRYEYCYVNKVLADYRVHSANHHSRIVLNKTEEPSVLWVLNKVYSERETNSDLETAKQRVRRAVYAAHYLDFADKYFGAGLNADARRCYWSAIGQQPRALLRPGVARRLVATAISRDLYERCKRMWYYPRKRWTSLTQNSRVFHS